MKNLKVISILFVLSFLCTTYLSANGVFISENFTLSIDTLIEEYDLTAKKSTSSIYIYQQPSSNQEITATGFRDFYGLNAALKKGEGYYRNLMLFGNTFRYGLTEHFSLGVSFELISLLVFRNKTEIPGFSIIPQFSWPIEKNKIRLSIGSFLFGLPYSGRIIEGGAVYGIATFGNQKANFSVGTGLTFQSDPGIERRQLITLLGSVKINKYFFLTTDNYIFSVENNNVLHNIISLRSKVLSYCDVTASILGIMDLPLHIGNLKNYETSFPIPFLSIIIRLGNRK